MAKRPLGSVQPLITLGVFLFVWWALPPVFKSFTQINLVEFQAPIWSAHSHLKDLQLYWSLRNHTKQGLIETGRDLARLNAAYQIRRQEDQSLRQEIHQLEQILNLPSLPDYRYEVARISRRDINQWWQQILIQKGEDYNIPEGAAVVYSEGVVGKVKKVYKNSALVELVSSPNFRVAAKFEGEHRPVTYQGQINTPFSQAHGDAQNISPDYKISPGQPARLISSRLGGVFPEGLTIGWVHGLTKSKDGLFQGGAVELPNTLFSLNEVAVLIPTESPTS